MLTQDLPARGTMLNGAPLYLAMYQSLLLQSRKWEKKRGTEQTRNYEDKGFCNPTFGGELTTLPLCPSSSFFKPANGRRSSNGGGWAPPHQPALWDSHSVIKGLALPIVKEPVHGFLLALPVLGTPTTCLRWAFSSVVFQKSCNKASKPCEDKYLNSSNRAVGEWGSNTRGLWETPRFQRRHSNMREYVKEKQRMCATKAFAWRNASVNECSTYPR